MVRRNPAEVADWLRARGKSSRPDVTRARASAIGEIFNLVDESGSGALDSARVREAFRVLGDANATVEDAERAMARVGIAPNGKMEFPEFLTIVTGPEPATPRLANGASAAMLPLEMLALSHRRARLIDRVVTNDGGARVQILERAEENARTDATEAAAAERRLRHAVATNATRAKYLDYGDKDKHDLSGKETHAERVMREKMARERRRRSMAYADGLGSSAMDARVYPTPPPETAEVDGNENENENRDAEPIEPNAPVLSNARIITRAREKLARRLGVDTQSDSERYVTESEWKFPEFDRTHRVARAARQRMALELADATASDVLEESRRVSFRTTCELLVDSEDESGDDSEDEDAGAVKGAKIGRVNGTDPTGATGTSNVRSIGETTHESVDAESTRRLGVGASTAGRLAASDDIFALTADELRLVPISERYRWSRRPAKPPEEFEEPPTPAYNGDGAVDRPSVNFYVRGGARRVDDDAVSDAISGAGRAARAAAMERVAAIEREVAERTAATLAWGEAWKAPAPDPPPPSPRGVAEVKASKIVALDAPHGSGARVASEAFRSVREAEVLMCSSGRSSFGLGFDGEDLSDAAVDALGEGAGGPLDVLGDSSGTAAQPGGGAVLCRLGLPDPNFVRLVDSST